MQWSGKYAATESLSREYKHLAKVSNHNESTLRVNRSRSFKLKFENDVKMLIPIQKGTVNRFLTLREIERLSNIKKDTSIKEECNGVLHEEL